MVHFKENYNFQSPTFSREGGGVVHFFLWGSNFKFPIETHLICDFLGASGPPVPPFGSAHGSVRKKLNVIHFGSYCIFEQQRLRQHAHLSINQINFIGIRKQGFGIKSSHRTVSFHVNAVIQVQAQTGPYTNIFSFTVNNDPSMFFLL